MVKNILFFSIIIAGYTIWSSFSEMIHQILGIRDLSYSDYNFDYLLIILSLILLNLVIKNQESK
jgi:hypothetical protein